MVMIIIMIMTMMMIRMLMTIMLIRMIMTGVMTRVILKMMMRKMKMITDHCPLPRFSLQPVTRSSKVRPENEIELDSVSK